MNTYHLPEEALIEIIGSRPKLVVLVHLARLGVLTKASIRKSLAFETAELDLILSDLVTIGAINLTGGQVALTEFGLEIVAAFRELKNPSSDKIEGSVGVKASEGEWLVNPIPSFALSKIELAKLPLVELPAFDLDLMPKIQMPFVRMPAFELSELKTVLTTEPLSTIAQPGGEYQEFVEQLYISPQFEFDIAGLPVDQLNLSLPHVELPKIESFEVMSDQGEMAVDDESNVDRLKEVLDESANPKKIYEAVSRLRDLEQIPPAPSKMVFVPIKKSTWVVEAKYISLLRGYAA